MSCEDESSGMGLEMRSRFDVRSYTQTPESDVELGNCVGGLRSAHAVLFVSEGHKPAYPPSSK